MSLELPKDLKYLVSCVTMAEIFSTCGKRQYFCIITDNQNHILGTGYNGGPKGMEHCEDGGCPRLQEGSAPGSSYDNCIAIHAEANAILHSDYSTRISGCTLYVNGPPCFSCAKLIANSGVHTVVYIEDDSYADWSKSDFILTSSGIRLSGYSAEEVSKARGLSPNASV